VKLENLEVKMGKIMQENKKLKKAVKRLREERSVDIQQTTEVKTQLQELKVIKCVTH